MIAEPLTSLHIAALRLDDQVSWSPIQYYSGVFAWISLLNFIFYQISLEFRIKRQAKRMLNACENFTVHLTNWRLVFMRQSRYWLWIEFNWSEHNMVKVLSCRSTRLWSADYFDNFITKFNSLPVTGQTMKNCRFFCLLTMKIKRWARAEFCSYCKSLVKIADLSTVGHF